MTVQMKAPGDARVDFYIPRSRAVKPSQGQSKSVKTETEEGGGSLLRRRDRR